MAGVKAVRAFLAVGKERGQTRKMHRPRNGMRLARANVLRLVHEQPWGLGFNAKTAKGRRKDSQRRKKRISIIEAALLCKIKNHQKSIANRLSVQTTICLSLCGPLCRLFAVFALKWLFQQ